MNTLSKSCLLFLLGLLMNVSFADAQVWTNWSKYSGNPVYSHVGNAASDPAVIKDGSTYRMVVSGNGGENPDGNSLNNGHFS